MSAITRLARTPFTLCIGLLLWTSSACFAEIPANAVWIDVRTPAEFAGGHLEGATLIPYQTIEPGIAELNLQRDTPIYLYCAVGGRAEAARLRLQNAGYTRVTNVGGLTEARALQRRSSP